MEEQNILVGLIPLVLNLFFIFMLDILKGKDLHILLGIIKPATSQLSGSK